MLKRLRIRAHRMRLERYIAKTAAAVLVTCAAFGVGADVGRPEATACAAGPCGTADYDGDRVKDWADNCPLAANPTQRDTDHDTPAPVIDEAAPPSPVGDQTGPIRLYPSTPYQSGQPAPTDMPPDVGGDACDADDDGDGVWDRKAAGHKGPDNCRLVPNPDQRDSDNDGIGDACDPTPNGAATAAPAPAKISVSLPRLLHYNQIRTGLLVHVGCTNSCQVAGVLQLDARSARRARLASRTLMLGQGAAFLADHGTTWLFVRIPARSIANLSRKLGHVRPVLRISAGRRTVAVRRITLRR